MSKPDDIPQDIWDAAVTHAGGYPLMRSMLARAIMAERERCARIAEEDIRSALAIDHDYKPTWYVRAEQIAAAIRKGDQP